MRKPPDGIATVDGGLSFGDHPLASPLHAIETRGQEALMEKLQVFGRGVAKVPPRSTWHQFLVT